jgi:uncharacterized protein (DUF169 family)
VQLYGKIFNAEVRMNHLQVSTPNETRSAGERMIALLGLDSAPVGVRFIAEENEVPDGALRLNQHRYCQALMRARRGEHVVLDAQGINCPAAAAAFGFRPLPENLQNGKGLVRFGIVSDEQVGQTMFAHMPVLQAGTVKAIELYPLDQAMAVPDVIVVEDQVEKLMWINLAYLNADGGERLVSSTAILQATCVDSTILPYLEQRLNFSFGCYGCRDATDLAASETVLGFPGNRLLDVLSHLEYLAQKAMPASRSKKAWSALQKQAARTAAQEAA